MDALEVNIKKQAVALFFFNFPLITQSYILPLWTYIHTYGVHTLVLHTSKHIDQHSYILHPTYSSPTTSSLLHLHLFFFSFLQIAISFGLVKS